MIHLERLLAELGAKLSQGGANAFPKSLHTLDARMADAVRADAAVIFAGVLSTLGQITPYGAPSNLRTASVCSLFGHVQYVRAYYAPAPENQTRQARRREAREKAAGHRRKRGGVFARKGGAPCACPLDIALQLTDGMTPAMQDRTQRAAAFSGSFAEGTATLQRFVGVCISESTFRRQALSAGERAVAAQEFPALRILTPFIPAWLLAASVATPPTLYIMLDGTGVPCVKKDTEGVKGKEKDGSAKTREVKVGVIGTFRRIDAKGRPIRDPQCESHIVSLKNAQAFGSLLRKLANSRGYGSGFRIQIVGDGADWIANIVKNAFPGSDITFTVDFYHACEYIQAFLVRAAMTTTKTAKAYKRARAILLRYGATTLIRHLHRHYPALSMDKAAVAALAYLEHRERNMRYGEYRKQGLFIGSGVVEAACRTNVVRRCKQSGMHWRFKNAAAMCALVARFRSNLAAA